VIDPQLAAARERTVRDHMRLETELDFEAVLKTFAHPRYELVGTGAEFDGAEAVRRYFQISRTPFPDQSNEIIALRACADAVIAEFWLTGTHLGPLNTPAGEIAPTGRKFRVRMCAIFEFAPESDKIVCERVYFDQASILRQLASSA
jgi:predicted ester cyclase